VGLSLGVPRLPVRRGWRVEPLPFGNRGVGSAVADPCASVLTRVSHPNDDPGPPKRTQPRPLRDHAHRGAEQRSPHGRSREPGRNDAYAIGQAE